MTEFDVYLWTRLDMLQQTLVNCSIIAGIGFLFSPIIVTSPFDSGMEVFKKIIRFLWILPILVILAVLTPSSKDYALIKILPKIANSDFAKQVPDDMQDMYTMAKLYLKERLEVKK